MTYLLTPALSQRPTEVREAGPVHPPRTACCNPPSSAVCAAPGRRGDFERRADRSPDAALLYVVREMAALVACRLEPDPSIDWSAEMGAK